jgi:hypothetical protein
MASPWQYLLTVGPLGVYFWVLAVWQSGPRPRVVRGLVDFGLFAFGVGGVLAFGPFGQLVTSLFRFRPTPIDQLLLMAALALWGCFHARRALHRIVVYDITPEDLTRVLEDVLSRTGGRFVPTLEGYEDRAGVRGLRVENTRWLHCAVIEAHGQGPRDLIRELRPWLRQGLDRIISPPTRVAPALFGCSVLVMLAPILGLLAAQPRAIQALQSLLPRWH